MFQDRYGPWAVIAGGSEGVGAELAVKLAEKGINLLLLARKSGPLADVAAQVRALGVDVRTLSIDLAAADIADRLAGAIEDIDVGLAIYNAGSVQPLKPFLDISLARHATTIGVNVTGCLIFCHVLGQQLCERGRGGLLITGSMAGFAGTALIAAYGATKAFEHNLAEALWYEWRDKGVDVLCMPIGTTRTPANERIGIRYDNNAVAVMTSEEVAEEALANLAHGPIWTAGAHNRETQQILCSPDRKRVTELISSFSTAVAPAAE